MANIKSQKKRIRTNEIARVRNKAIRSELKTVIKHVKTAVEAGDKAAAQAAATTAYRKLDKAVAKGVIHKNQAANRKSGVQNLVNSSRSSRTIRFATGPVLTGPVFCRDSLSGRAGACRGGGLSFGHSSRSVW